MKKQLMTLAVCLALTTTSALASSPKTATKETKPTTPPMTCQAKKTPEVTPCPKEIAKQKFEERMAKDREELYCKLGLSAEQKTKAEAIHQEDKKSVEPLFAKLHAEKTKLHELKAKKACIAKIEKQKLKVKEAKHAIKAHMEKSRKEFEALLDKDQLVKFNAIREEQKEQREKCKCHHHHHGAFNHDHDDFHGPFGPEPGHRHGPDNERPAPKCPCEFK